MMKKNRNIRPWFVSLGAFLWASDAFPRSKLTKEFSSTFIVFFDSVLSLIVTIPLFIRERTEILKFRWRDWLSLIVIAIGGHALATILFTKAFATATNYSIPILIQKLQPIIAILFAALLLKERLNERFWSYSIIAIIGAYLVSFGNQFVLGSIVEATTKPVLYALLAAVLWGGSTVAGRYLLKRFSFPFITSLRYLFGAIFLFGLVLAEGQLGEIFKLNMTSIAFFLIIAYIPGFLGLFIYYYGLKGTKASIATICELAYPVSAVIVNWVFLGSALSFWQIIGTLVLLVSITLLSYENSKMK